MFADGVMESSNTIGTATYTLTGARFNGLTFASKFTNNAVVLFIAQTLNRSKYEIILGTFLTGPSRLVRSTVLQSSNGGSKISWLATDSYYISCFASADALAGFVNGNLATTRPWWVGVGARWLDYSAGVATSWIDKLVKNDGSDIRVGSFDAVKGLYFPDNRVSSTSVGAANKSFNAADIGGAFTFNTSAAGRTATLPTAAMAVGDGYTLQLNTTSSQYGLTITPDAGQSIDYLGNGVSKVVPGGTNVRIRWDAAVSQWFTNFLGPDEVTVASAATVDLAAVRSQNVLISGTTGITSMGSVTRGAMRFVRFSASLTLTHSSSLFLCNNAQNIRTEANDTAIFFASANNTWRCVSYQRASGAPLNVPFLTLSLGANVAMNATATYFTGPSVAQGTVGIWDVTGKVTVAGPVGGDIVDVKLWDGNTVIDSCRMHLVSVSGTYYGVATLSGCIANPGGDLRISVSPVSRADGFIAYNASGNGKDSTITAKRIG